MKELSIMRCKFRFNKEDSYKTGVMINKDKLIIDMNGNIVPAPVYDFILYPTLGTTIIRAEHYE